MRILSRAIFAALLGTVAAAALPVRAADQPAFSPHKGVGVYRPFNWLRPSPVDGSLFVYPWNCFFGAADFARLTKAGFDTIRIAMEPEVFWRLDAAGQDKARADAGSLIQALNAAGLKVVFVFGASPNSQWNAKVLTRAPDSAEFQAYREAVRGMAKYLSRFDPAKVAFEPFNEPPGPCNWTDHPAWPVFQELLYRDARQAAPRTTLILTSACAASAESFQYLPVDADYVKDPNTIFTLHYYDPYDFTLQSEYRLTKYVAHLPYPADPAKRSATEAATQARLASAPDLNDASRPVATAAAMQEIASYFGRSYDAAYIERKFDLVEAWRQKAGIPASRIMLGEFGVVRQFGATGALAAADEDRTRWYGLVRQAAEKRSYGWLAWSYFADMSIFDDDPPRWQTAPRHLNPRLMDALGLSQNGNAVAGTDAASATNPAVCK